MAIEENSLHASHISNALEDYEAARSGFFSLIVSDIDNIIRADYSGDKNDNTANNKIKNAQDVLRLSVVKADVPHFSLNPLEFRRGNDVVKFAGTPTFNGGSITVDDFIGKDAKSVLMAWQALAYDVKTRKGGRMKDYKKTCTLVEYTQDFEEIRSWKMYGCWVSDISESDFNKESDDKRQITATIQYDRAEMIVTGSVKN